MWLINWALPELAVAWRKYRIWNLVRDKRFHPDVDSDEAFAQENVSEKDGQVLGCLSVSVEHACEIARPMTHERNHLTNLETHVIVQNKKNNLAKSVLSSGMKCSSILTRYGFSIEGHFHDMRDRIVGNKRSHKCLSAKRFDVTGYVTAIHEDFQIARTSFGAIN